jgi:hypothetical protein
MTAYSNNESNSLSVFNINSLLDGTNDDTKDELWLFNDKVQHPLEHYLTKAKELNVQ